MRCGQSEVEEQKIGASQEGWGKVKCGFEVAIA